MNALPEPILIHVPEDPTVEQVRTILRHMVYTICYYETERPAPSERHDPPGSFRRELTPVMGLCWEARQSPNHVTVYIEGKPYAVDKDWLPDDERERLYGDGRTDQRERKSAARPSGAVDY